jgi:hypothetical protein
VSWSFDAVCAHTDNAFLLRSRASGLRLKGQLIPYALPPHPAPAPGTAGGGRCRLARRLPAAPRPVPPAGPLPLPPHPLPAGLAGAAASACPFLAAQAPCCSVGGGGCAEKGGGVGDCGEVLLLMCSPMVTGLDEMMRLVLQEKGWGGGYHDRACE